MKNGSGVNKWTTPYREDTGKKDQGWGFLVEGSASPAPDEDGTGIMAVATPAIGEQRGTCKMGVV
jgi:hypothetical protein